MDKLDERETSALLDALDDEYKSWTTYDLAVYEALRLASQERHLPAFQRCVQRGG